MLKVPGPAGDIAYFQPATGHFYTGHPLGGGRFDYQCCAAAIGAALAAHPFETTLLPERLYTPYKGSLGRMLHEFMTCTEAARVFVETFGRAVYDRFLGAYGANPPYWEACRPVPVYGELTLWFFILRGVFLASFCIFLLIPICF